MGNISEKLQTLNGLIDQLIANQGSGGSDDYGSDDYGTRVDVDVEADYDNIRIPLAQALTGSPYGEIDYSKLKITKVEVQIKEANMDSGEWPPQGGIFADATGDDGFCATLGIYGDFKDNPIVCPPDGSYYGSTYRRYCGGLIIDAMDGMVFAGKIPPDNYMLSASIDNGYLHIGNLGNTVESVEYKFSFWYKLL